MPGVLTHTLAIHAQLHGTARKREVHMPSSSMFWLVSASTPPVTATFARTFLAPELSSDDANAWAPEVSALDCADTASNFTSAHHDRSRVAVTSSLPYNGIIGLFRKPSYNAMAACCTLAVRFCSVSVRRS
jgi:hypothetical protein